MTNRLKQICSMIPKNGIGFADIGTDHGIVPVWLAENNYRGNLFASDIAAEALQKAIAYANTKNFGGRIHFSVSDGLDDCPESLTDCILIAGMGGDTICKILDRADWIFSGDRTFIFQPMTHPEVLRYWLVHNDFQIRTEAAVLEEQHLYQIFSASPGKNESMRDIDYLAGNCLVHREGEPLETVYSILQKRIQRKLSGIEASIKKYNSTFYFYQNILNDLNQLI